MIYYQIPLLCLKTVEVVNVKEKECLDVGLGCQILSEFLNTENFQGRIRKVKIRILWAWWFLLF